GPRVVEPGGDRVGLDDLAVLVLEVVGAGAVEDAGHAPGDRRPVPARLQTVAAGFDADEAGRRVEEPGERAHGVAAAPDAGHHPLGIGAAEQRPALGPGLVAHHPL